MFFFKYLNQINEMGLREIYIKRGRERCRDTKRERKRKREPEIERQREEGRERVSQR